MLVVLQVGKLQISKDAKVKKAAMHVHVQATRARSASNSLGQLFADHGGLVLLLWWWEWNLGLTHSRQTLSCIAALSW